MFSFFTKAVARHQRNTVRREAIVKSISDLNNPVVLAAQRKEVESKLAAEDAVQAAADKQTEAQQTEAAAGKQDTPKAALFEKMYKSFRPVDYVTAWSNATGYFDGATDLVFEENVCSIDPNGRRVVIIPFAPGKNLVVFERYYNNAQLCYNAAFGLFQDGDNHLTSGEFTTSSQLFTSLMLKFMMDKPAK